MTLENNDTVQQKDETKEDIVDTITAKHRSNESINNLV